MYGTTLREKARQAIAKAATEQARRLQLSGHDLSEFPLDILNLENLETLDLSNNSITHIPGDIYRLSKLKTLVLRNNILTAIPEEIGELGNLKRLLLGGNNLLDLPFSIRKLKALNELHLSSNQLSAIPDCIFDLENLKVLWLAFNVIKNIPPEIGRLKNLKTLYLQNNKLQEVPDELMKIESLQSVFLLGNPMYLMPLYDWTGNKLNELKTYFFSLEEGKEKSYAAKLIFIGKGGEGKTTLRERLINPSISRADLTKIQTTGGVEIKILSNIIAENDKYYDISMWDFGGQEILRNIHHLFLTDSALYLLLWSSRISENKYAYFKEWLGIISAENPESKVKVILIHNRSYEEDSVFDPIDQENLQRLFPKLVDFVDVSALEGKGIEGTGLRYKLQQHLKDLPTIKIVSRKWLGVKDTIDKLRKERNIISTKNFETVCSANKILTEDEIEQLLEWLHQIGAILWYKDIRALREDIFLKPDWVSNNVNKILIDKDGKIREMGGKFALDDFIKENNEKAKDLDKIIQLMEGFNLCFNVDEETTATGKSKTNTYIIPLLLPEKESSNVNLKEWEKDAIDFKYEYSLMPRGILAQFISWAYREEKLEGENYWQNGVVLKFRDRTRALVTYDLFEEDTAKEVIRIQVDGPKRELLLDIIRDHFDKKLNKRAKLERRLISCRGLKCQGGGRIFNYFDLDILEEMSNQDVEAVQCHKCFKNIPLRVFNNFVESYNNERLSNILTNSKEKKLKIFISYSHADSDFFKVFKAEFDNIAKSAQMEVFTDEGIPVGVDWDEYLKDKVSKCNVMILLVSSGFLGSDYIREKEFGEALRRLADGQRIRIIPVYFRPCDEHGADLSKLQFFKPKGKLYGSDKEDFSFCDLVKFSNTDGRLIPDNHRHQYVIDLKKKIVESWRAFNNETKD